MPGAHAGKRTGTAARSLAGPAALPAGLLGLLALLIASCGAPAGSPAVEGPDPAWFDPSAMIDVLPPDAIPAIREPSFESVDDASGWLDEADPVLALEVEGEARAYPLGILTRHEIVNDRIAGIPVAVTYCPLCNSALVYERTVSGRTLTFLVSGKLYHSDLVMLDEETTSLWPQLRGVAVRGPLKGLALRRLPSSLASLGEFRAAYPDGRVLARPGTASYGSNPYPGYDTRGEPYAEFYTGDLDERLPAMERVVGVTVGAAARAYPFSALASEGTPAVVHDTVGGRPIVVFYGGEARSAIDGALIARSRAVGAAGAFAPDAGERSLRFTVRDGKIVDEQTGSTWNVLGVALRGPLAGHRLPRARSVDALWFAWRAFVPHTTIWRR